MAEDTMDRLRTLLSDGESLQQIAELAQMLKTGDISGDEPPEQEADMPDFDMLAGLAGIAGAMQQSDADTELLMALRPHLGEEKQLRLDKAVKLLKLAAIVGAAKESGLINTII